MWAKDFVSIHPDIQVKRGMNCYLYAETQEIQFSWDLKEPSAGTWTPDCPANWEDVSMRNCGKL